MTSGYWSNLFHPFRYSSRISISEDTGRIHIFSSTTSPSSSNWGLISKSIDRGTTWSTAFPSSLAPSAYFNAIDCLSISRCIAVTEGNERSNLRIYLTEDGGGTWIDSVALSSPDLLPSNTVSLMCVSWVGSGVNVIEAWVAGASIDYLGRVTGLFFQTTDGGRTFQLSQVFHFIDLSQHHLFRHWRIVSLWIWISLLLTLHWSPVCLRLD